MCLFFSIILSMNGFFLHVCLFRLLVDADNLQAKNIESFYNSVTLLGEFYNRLHQKQHPILIMGSSLFEVLTKQLRCEIEECKNNEKHVFDVQFARLILAQVSFMPYLLVTKLRVWIIAVIIWTIEIFTEFTKLAFFSPYV